MLVQYIFADTMSHDQETNADVALANTFLVSNQTCTYSLKGCVPLRRFRSGSVIPDHSDHVRSNEPIIHSRQGFIGSLDLP